jgi:hypothetical protein
VGAFVGAIVGPNSFGHVAVGADSFCHLTVEPNLLGHAFAGPNSFGHLTVGANEFARLYPMETEAKTRKEKDQKEPYEARGACSSQLAGPPFTVPNTSQLATINRKPAP